MPKHHKKKHHAPPPPPLSPTSQARAERAEAKIASQRAEEARLKAKAEMHAERERMAEEAVKQQHLHESGLVDAEIAEYRELFDLCDDDGGGSIGEPELMALMKSLGLPEHQTEPEVVHALVMEIDTDGSGEIEFEEFVAMMQKNPLKGRDTKEALGDFRAFELDADSRLGWCRVEKLQDCLTRLCTPPLSAEVAEGLLVGIPADCKEEHWVTNNVGRREKKMLINYASMVELLSS